MLFRSVILQASGISANKIITNDIPYFILSGSTVSLANLLSIMYGSNKDGSSAILNFFGFNTASLSAKLLMMPRYGNFVSDFDDAGLPYFYGASKVLDMLGYGSFLDSLSTAKAAVTSAYLGRSYSGTDAITDTYNPLIYKTSQTVKYSSVIGLSEDLL